MFADKADLWKRGRSRIRFEYVFGKLGGWVAGHVGLLGSEPDVIQDVGLADGVRWGQQGMN